jgi:hypothetical protein
MGVELGNKDEADGVIRRVLNGEKKVTAQHKTLSLSLSLSVDCAVLGVIFQLESIGR